MTLHEKLKKYFEEVFSGPDFSMYHYTKAGIGNEIINSGHFRLTSHPELNKKSDNGELIIGPDLTRIYLKKTKLSTWEPIFNEFIKRGIMLHIGSFSENENHTHASNKYGPDRLEFKTEYWKKLQNLPNLLIGRVEYDKKKQDEIISTMFGLYEETTGENLIQRRCSLFQWLITAYPLLKEQKHHVDEECRIITVNGYDIQGNQMGQTFDKIKFVATDVVLKT